jgi:tRNA A37 threonylcarbamoyltransferase TsaD
LGKRQNLVALIPAFEYCTDNAAMIAQAGHYLLENGLTGKYTDLPFVKASY